MNSPEDTNDGTCVSPFVNSANDCTLREAIVAANNNGGLDTITFSIDASFANTAYDDLDGQYTTTLASAYAALAGPTIIDASAIWDVDDDRPGFKILRNSDAAAALTFSSGATDSRISGLEFDGHSRAIVVAATNVIIGTNCDGSIDARERNVMHGASLEEIFINGVSGAKILGNYIGTQSDGITASTFGSAGINIVGSGADSVVVGYGEGTSGSCSAAVQRNIIGGGDDSTDAGVRLFSSTTNTSGDAASAPNSVRITGNYIGIGSDGTTDIGGLGDGILVSGAATQNWIGTDGDGVDDTLEGNVIGGWGLNGVNIVSTGYNRVAGNLIGFDATGAVARGNGGEGIVMLGTGNIAGWCDTSIDATICFDGGAVADEANHSGNNTNAGIRLGAGCLNCRVAGNVLGTSTDGTQDFGNGTQGIFVHRGNTGVVLGGSSASYGNLVRFNNFGIIVDGYYSGSPFTPGPTEDYTVQYNTVSENDSVGIRILGTEQDGTEGPSDGTVSSNTISQNGTDGIQIFGSSPTISTNTISDNTEIAISLHTEYRRDEPLATATTYSNPYDTLSPDNAANDSVSQPIISGNTIDGNGSGIYILDAAPSNLATLEADNTIGTNGSYDVRRDWYAGFEIFDPSGSEKTSGTVVARLVPAHGLSCSSACIVGGFDTVTASSAIWGPTGVSYDDAATWFTLTDYDISTNGTQLFYNPYEVRVIGAQNAHVRITVDGNTGDDVEVSGSLDAGISTSGIDRYQIFDVRTVQKNGANPMIQAPIAGVPIVEGPDTIRWVFAGQTGAEVGFSILRKDSFGEQIVADSGPGLAPGLLYLEEKGLKPDTQYCGRSVVAYIGSSYSPPAILPCARTLASVSKEGNQGEDSSQNATSSLPVLSLTTSVFLMSPSRVLATAAFSGLGMGLFVLPRMRKRGKKQIDPFWFHLAKISIGVTLLVFVLHFLLPASVVADGLLVPIDDQMVLTKNQTVRFGYEVQNTGGAPAEHVVLSVPVPQEVLLDPATIKAEQEGESLSVNASSTTMTLSIATIPAGGSVTLAFDAQIVSSGTPEVTAQVTAQGIDEVFATPQYLHIDVSSPSKTARAHYHPLTVLRTQTDPSLYFVDASDTRRLFPNETIYHTWFPSLNNVRDISDADMQSVPNGEVMGVRPGTLLVKEASHAAVYAVEPGKRLHRLPSEAYAARVYGSDWSTLIVTISAGELGTYKLRPAFGEEDLPDGILVTDGTNVCYMQANTCRPLTKNGWKANRFSEEFLRNIDPSFLATFPKQNPILQTEAALLFE